MDKEKNERKEVETWDRNLYHRLSEKDQGVKKRKFKKVSLNETTEFLFWKFKNENSNDWKIYIVLTHSRNLGSDIFQTFTLIGRNTWICFGWGGFNSHAISKPHDPPPVLVLEPRYLRIMVNHITPSSGVAEGEKCIVAVRWD